MVKQPPIEEKETLSEKVLRLIYGTHQPMKNQQPIFSVECVARYLRKSYYKILYIKQRYFRTKSSKYKKKESKLPAHLKEMLCSEKYLRQNATLTIEERVKKLEWEYQVKIGREYLRRMYK